jgi:hypothetical protein
MKSKIAVLIFLLSMTACPELVPDGDAGPSTTDLSDAGSEDIAPLPLGPCEEAADLPTDPVTVSSAIDLKDSPLTQGTIHVLDVAVDNGRELLFTAGVGGLFVVDLSTSPPTILSQTRDGPPTHSLALLADDQVTQCNRDTGCRIMDTSDPSSPNRTARISLIGAAGARQLGESLVVSSHLGELVVYDLTSTTGMDLTELGRVDGLGNPWNHVIQNNIAYVADNTLGLVVVDLENLQAPSIVTEIETPGGVQDVAVLGDYLYAAQGGAGIEVFSLAEPRDPVSVAILDAGSSVISVSLTETSLWATSHEGVHLWDVTDPTDPISVSFEPTEEWAMHVDAMGSTAYVADWSRVVIMDADTSILAPYLDLDKNELYFYEGTQDAQISLTNRGNTDLLLSGLSIDDPRFSVALTEQTTIGPMESLVLDIAFEDDGAEVDTVLCLATNDPNQPIIEVTLASSSGDEADLAIGQDAIDFVLQDLEGNSHQLALQLGKPVILVYFATW